MENFSKKTILGFHTQPVCWVSAHHAEHLPRVEFLWLPCICHASSTFYFKHYLIINCLVEDGKTWQECFLYETLSKLFKELNSIQNSGCYGNRNENFRNLLVWTTRLRALKMCIALSSGPLQNVFRGVTFSPTCVVSCCTWKYIYKKSLKSFLYETTLPSVLKFSRKHCLLDHYTKIVQTLDLG